MKKLLAALVLVAVVSAAAFYWHARGIEQESAREFAAHNALTEKFRSEGLAQKLKWAADNFESGSKRAEDVLQENQRTGNRIEAQKVFEMTMARLRQERDDAIKAAQAANR